MSTNRQLQYDAGSTGLSFGEREPRARRSLQPADRLSRSRDELAGREESDGRQWEPTEQPEGGRREMDASEADRRRSTRATHSQERDIWRENRRQHQSSQILLGFGSATPRWETGADMGRRCTSSSQLEAAGQRSPQDGKAAAAAAAAAAPPLAAATAASALLFCREEPSARRHRSDLTPTAPAGHSFRDPPPSRHRSPGVTAGSSSSRPSSALSQQSGAPSAARASPLRLRTGTRRPRPSSIAGMPSRTVTDAGKQQAEASRLSSRSGSASTPRRPLPASAPTSEARRPPPSSSSTASPRRTPAQVKADDARKKKQRSKSGTPQPSEQHAPVHQPGSSGGSELSASPAPSGSSTDGASEQPRDVSTEPPAGGVAEPTPQRESPVVSVQSATPPPTPAPAAAAEQISEGSTPGRRAGYDSEAAARAALAEKRRQAREEAERQAELERQRQEEQERQEQERLRQEEQMMEEAARAEQERLQKAIQEAEERRAEEERQRQEEEEQRRLKEAEEAAARLEAERARVAAAEKLQREEAERKERRSRVAAIMSRTRTNNNSTSTNNNNVPDKTGSSDEETTGPAAPQITVSRTAESEERSETEPASDVSDLQSAPAHHEAAPDQEQEPEPEPELPMSTDSSPAHTNITNGTNGLDDDVDPSRVAADAEKRSNGTGPNGESNGTLLPPLNSLSLKPAASDDEDSFNSNVSPQPDSVPLGLTGGPPPELGHAGHTTELVQL